MLPLPRRCRDEFLKNLPLPHRYHGDLLKNLPLPCRHRLRGSAAMDISAMWIIRYHETKKFFEERSSYNRIDLQQGGKTDFVISMISSDFR